MTEGDKFWTQRGREIRLGKPVAAAGKSVYAVQGAHEVVAVIHDDGSDATLRERKIEAMLKKPPALADVVEDGQRFVRMDWPVATLHDKSRKFVGYLKPALDMKATSPLENVLRERKARAEGLPSTLGAKINLAARLAVAITELHQLDHRVVYLTPSSLRFYRESLHVSLVDCERLSIRANLDRYAADPGPAGINNLYIAPEFQGKPIPAGKEEAQDRFALAVILFQLLNAGIHPYDGLPTRDDVPEDIPTRIARHMFAYGPKPHPDLEPDPDSGLKAMPKEFQALFHRAFANDGSPRPPALDWAAWLQFYSIPSNNRVVVCAANPTHHHYAELPCAACERDPLPPPPPSEPPPPDNRAKYVTVEPSETNGQSFVPLERAFPMANRFKPAEKPALQSARLGLLRRLTFTQTVGVLAVLFVGIAYFATRTPSPEAAPPPSQQRPVDEPPPKAGDPYLAAEPDLARSEAETEGYVTTATRAIATEDRPGWQSAILNLHTDAPEHEPVAPNGFQQAFADYAAKLSPSHVDEGKRQELLKRLGDVLMRNPYDDEAAWELAWLNLVGGRRDEAKVLLLHAIWVNPDRAEAWYGLGVVGEDDERKTGALATAELLMADPAKADAVRRFYPPLLLQLNALKPEPFAKLQDKARALAEKYRPLVAAPSYASDAASGASAASGAVAGPDSGAAAVASPAEASGNAGVRSR